MVRFPHTIRYAPVATEARPGLSHPDAALFEIVGRLVFVYTLMGAVLCAGGLFLLRNAVRAYRADRALAQRVRSMRER